MKIVNFQLENFSMIELSDSSPVKIAEYFSQNKIHLIESMSLRGIEFYSKQFWSDAVEQYRANRAAGGELRWFLHMDEKIIGHVNIDRIVKGAFQSCYLGYGIDAEFQGLGLMRQALQRALDFIFSDLALNRVMANYEPDNIRSANLLRSLGFEKEGYARSYLKLNGRWKDHVLTSMIAEDYRAGASQRAT